MSEANLSHHLTPQEILKGVEHSIERRAARHELLLLVEKGELGVAELLDQGKHGNKDLIAGRMEIGDVVLAVNGIGPVRAAQILCEVEVEEDQHLNSLTEHERCRIGELSDGTEV